MQASSMPRITVFFLLFLFLYLNAGVVLERHVLLGLLCENSVCVQWELLRSRVFETVWPALWPSRLRDI